MGSHVEQGKFDGFGMNKLEWRKSCTFFVKLF